MTTLAILFPGHLGYHLFVRWPRDRVRRFSVIVHASDLAEAVGPLGDPLVVGLVGTRQMDFVAEQVLAFADLVAIPSCWLRRVPRRDLQRRAEVAASILTAHRTAPLRHYLGRERWEQAVLPF